MLKYKLTDQNLQTYNKTQWVIGESKTTSGIGNLCGPGWLHYYHHPLLSILLNPIHANISNPKLFEIEVAGNIKEDKGLKAGCTELTLVKEIELPVITITQKVAFAILCTQTIYKEISWNKWANNWLNNIDRTKQAAAYAAHAANAAYAAAYAAANAAHAANAAYAAANADYAAVNAAADAADAADAAANAAHAAYASYDFLIKYAIKCLEY